MNFNAASPMESKHRRFALLRKIFQPWQWETEEKRNRLNRRQELYRKYRCVQPKDQLVKKTFLCLFSSGLDERKKGKYHADSVQSG
ncbi:hypothetical protein TNCV_4330161 [Trichonephila clavipes]|nr:hypothetical protein TNCV_4330161 [Trichonephila clavipes]